MGKNVEIAFEMLDVIIKIIFIMHLNFERTVLKYNYCPQWWK